MVGWITQDRDKNGSAELQTSKKSMVQKCDRTVSCPPKKWYKNGLNVPTEPKSLLQQIRRVEILTENEPQKVVFDRRHFREHFNTEAYLKDFYEVVDDPAMQMVLFYLPNIAARLPFVESLLDFGAGPTIHVAICFRNKAENIFLADYLPQNRLELSRWLKQESTFNWNSVLRIIATLEGLDGTKCKDMEVKTREKVKGIFYCNCLVDPSVDVPGYPDKTFDIITTFFTIEYCCLSLSEYESAISRICSKLSPKGTLILGGILEESWCSFGGRRFTCLFITKKFVLECLTKAGMNVDINDDVEDQSNRSTSNMFLYEVNGMFIIVCHKK